MATIFDMESSRGFTLIELIAVIVILGVISWVATSRFSSPTYQLQQSRDNLIAALFIAQQQAMAQSSSAQLTLTISNNVLSLSSKDLHDFSDQGIQFPFRFAAPVKVSSVSLQYDKLGRTTPVDIQLTLASVSTIVRVESSGFAYAR